MKDLRSALFGAGIVSKESLAKAEDERKIAQEEDAAWLSQRDFDQERRMGVLQETDQPERFRKFARELLLDNPALIGRVAQLAESRGMYAKGKAGERLAQALGLLSAHLAQPSLSDEAKRAAVAEHFTKT